MLETLRVQKHTVFDVLNFFTEMYFDPVQP